MKYQSIFVVKLRVMWIAGTEQRRRYRGVGAWTQRTSGQHAPMLVWWPGAYTLAPKEVLALTTYVVVVLERSEARDSGGLGEMKRRRRKKQVLKSLFRHGIVQVRNPKTGEMRWGEKVERTRENGNCPGPWENRLANLPQPLPLRHSATAVSAIILTRANTSP